MALRSVLSEKYVEVFVGFEKDLDDTQQAYEAFKVNENCSIASCKSRNVYCN